LIFAVFVLLTLKCLTVNVPPPNVPPVEPAGIVMSLTVSLGDL
jgi:hypothetical protein